MTTESAAAQRALRLLMPGRTHLVGAGPFLHPGDLTPMLARGEGARVLDVDGTWYVEYGMAMGAVTLGYGYFPVVRAVTEAVVSGTSFAGSNVWELAAAQRLVEQIPGAEMVRFTNSCSDARAVAARLAREATGRDLIAVATERSATATAGFAPPDYGIGDHTEQRTVPFRYGDLNSLHERLADHPGRIAAFFLEAATVTTEPPPGYLRQLRELADLHGCVLIFDESLTGMRWAVGGAQEVYGVLPDLSVWGRALGNGFPISALVGHRSLMELATPNADGRRGSQPAASLGAGTAGLAAYLAVADAYPRLDAVGVMERQGRLLAEGVRAVVAGHGLSDYVTLEGRASCLTFETRDPGGRPSQPLHRLLTREMLRRGVLARSFVVSAAHTDDDIAVTLEAVDGALRVYAEALEARSAASRLEDRPVRSELRRCGDPSLPPEGEPEPV